MISPSLPPSFPPSLPPSLSPSELRSHRQLDSIRDHPLVVGDETVLAAGLPLIVQQHHSLNQSAASLSPLIRQPVAQAILQLDSGVLVAAISEAHLAHHQLVKPFIMIQFLRFEALLERPVVGRNGRYLSIADAHRSLQNFLAKVLKASTVV